MSVSVQASDVFQYHVIVGELLFPDHLSDGTLKSTLLGDDYQVQFHLNDNNQVETNGPNCKASQSCDSDTTSRALSHTGTWTSLFCIPISYIVI